MKTRASILSNQYLEEKAANQIVFSEAGKEELR